MGLKYQDKGDGPLDISWLPLGNCTGRLIAVEAPAGLPIITSLRSPCSSRSVIGGASGLQIDYHNANGQREDWDPWKICFQDGMQPAVGIVDGEDTSVWWPSGMEARSRRWVDSSSILETVNRSDQFELTTTDCIVIGQPLLLRHFSVKNRSEETLNLRLYHYAPLNPSGRSLRTYNKTKDYRQIESDNACRLDLERGRLLFTSEGEKGRPWIMGSPTRPSSMMCGMFPDSLEAISRGESSRDLQSTSGVVDGALVFELGDVEPGAERSVYVYAACGMQRDLDTAFDIFDELLDGFDPEEAMKTTTAFWAEWNEMQEVPNDPSGPVEALVRRLLAVIKASTWDIGGMPCDGGELTDFYFRDSLRPAMALALFGDPKEAERTLLALQAITAACGYNNCNGFDWWIGDAVEKGVKDVSEFQPSKEFSVDDPALVVFTIGRMWEMFGNEDFITRIWPFLKYSCELGFQDMTSNGVITQNSGFQDGMVHWAFPRGRDPFGSAPGITCSYWNMVWARAYELGAAVADQLGHADDAARWRGASAGIRDVIEDKFWDEEKGRYAYFYDPERQARYFAGSGFSSVKEEDGGQYVFPEPVLGNGATLLHWCGFSNDERAKRSYELVRDQLLPLPEDLVVDGPFDSTMCDESHRYHGADQSLSYARLLYAACEVGDRATADLVAEWLTRHIPLAGVPEVLPTCVRAVQLWPCGEVLIALHRYLSSS